MKGTLKIGQAAGIGIFVHWTFAILLLWVAVAFLVAGEGSPATMLYGLALLACIFGCVVLHELGHALTARRYGIRTRDITLLPIGGIARLERMPEKPFQELVVALAGPAVNVVIAGILSGAILALGRFSDLLRIEEETRVFQIKEGVFYFLANLMVVNVLLALFNLLPAFPIGYPERS